MRQKRQFAPITTLGHELADEISEIKADLARLQQQARDAGDWKKELAVLDRRLKVLELRLREVREYSANILNVNFDVDAKIAEKMAIAFLARQRQLRDNGEDDAK